MYAVIETGGKQYRVEVGTELEVELLDAEAGSNIRLERILLVADGDEATIGRPVVADAAVEAEVLRRARGEKLIAFKYRPKARRRVKKGHRQELTVLRIADIRFKGKGAADEVRKAERAAKTERERLEEAAAKQAAEDAALAARLAKREAKADTSEAPKRGRAKPAPAPSAKAPKRTRATKDTSPKSDTPAPRRRAKKDE
jgi:large subunit ribosomal protein L21